MIFNAKNIDNTIANEKFGRFEKPNKQNREMWLFLLDQYFLVGIASFMLGFFSNLFAYKRFMSQKDYDVYPKTNGLKLCNIC